MSDSENGSEFDGEIEETEFGLYMQLYFESNPEYKACDSSHIRHKLSGKENIEESPKSNENINEDKETEVREYDRVSDKGKECTTSCINENNITFSRNVNKNDTKGRDTADNTDIPCSESPDGRDPQSQLKRVSRDRLSSICSIDSISGSVPLDNLYCVDLISDEEEGGINQKLAMSESLDQEAPRETSNSKKRKRFRYSSDSDREESRCASIVMKVKTHKKRITSKERCSTPRDSDDNEDVYVLPPPPPQQVSVVDLASTSDSDPAVDTNLKEKPNTKTKCKFDSQVDHTPKCISKAKAVKSPKKLVNGDLSQIIAALKRGNKRTNFASESDTESETDSLEGELETNLTMNLDKGLKRYLENDKQHKNRTTGKVKNVRSFDYSKTLTKSTHLPSCKKWTASMASFYDTDISEDLHIEAVHQQQTNSRRDWHINANDYPVQQRGRYFTREVRCTRCRQFGHLEKDCPRVPHCHLCSQTGHTVRYMCPDNCCFRCGGEPHGFCYNTSAAVRCHLCGFHGHRMQLCPDLWRRFHITTSGEEVQSPDYHEVRPLKEQYCCICAKRGHYSYICPLRHENSYYCHVPQTVISYSSPALQKNGKLTGTSGDEILEVPADITKFSVQQRDAGRLIGRQGLVVKEVQKLSNTKIIITTKHGKCQVHICGSWKDRKFAKGILHVLLGIIPVGEYKEYITNIANVTDDPNIQDLLTYSDSNKVFTELEESNQSLQGYHGRISKSSSRILDNLPRTKEDLLAKIAESISDIRSVDFNVKRRVKLLKKERDLFDFNDASPDIIRRVQKLLNELSRVIIGREMYGNGKDIHKSLSTLQSQVEACKSNRVPEDLCENIAHTLCMVYNPSIEKVDIILSYAEDYLEKVRQTNGKKEDYLERFRSTYKKKRDNNTLSGENGFKVLKKKLKRVKSKSGNLIKNLDLICKHNRLQLKCKHCKNEAQEMHSRCRHNAKQKNCGLCKKQKDMKKKGKMCIHDCLKGKCKKCKKKKKPKRNSTAFWNEIFKN
ncbi:uncharacterized protein LOC125030535 [Penaeus chinensis]|uniref:uncharacterized protein LOC125030535 n=1 Tax=Penaeus chinensis TaxID=139456 RepID=UPI001FB82B22|nr:uncharacterized protein LOC125030535 [Penaeus chinensis]